MNVPCNTKHTPIISCTRHINNNYITKVLTMTKGKPKHVKNTVTAKYKGHQNKKICKLEMNLSSNVIMKLPNNIANTIIHNTG